MNQDTKGAIYDQKASEHSKNAIFLWLVTGIVWIFFDGKIGLFSVRGILLFFPGIFIASFASMPLFLLRNKIALNVIEKKQESLASLIPFLNLLDLIEMILAPIFYLFILKGLPVLIK